MVFVIFEFVICFMCFDAFVYNTTVYSRNYVIGTHSTWDRTIFFKNFKLYLWCFLYLLGIKRTTRNWKGGEKMSPCCHRNCGLVVRSDFMQRPQENVFERETKASNYFLFRHYGDKGMSLGFLFSTLSINHPAMKVRQPWVFTG